MAESARDFSDWLEGELRSDHAGETGAVWQQSIHCRQVVFFGLQVSFTKLPQRLLGSCGEHPFINPHRAGFACVI